MRIALEHLLYQQRQAGAGAAGPQRDPVPSGMKAVWVSLKFIAWASCAPCGQLIDRRIWSFSGRPLRFANKGDCLCCIPDTISSPSLIPGNAPNVLLSGRCASASDAPCTRERGAWLRADQSVPGSKCVRRASHGLDGKAATADVWKRVTAEEHRGCQYPDFTSAFGAKWRWTDRRSLANRDANDRSGHSRPSAHSRMPVMIASRPARSASVT
jgi:hypothetical protein